MANVKRTVKRAAKPGAAEHFDEQFWPICIALVILSGFLMG